jgi:hypothetical protein
MADQVFGDASKGSYAGDLMTMRGPASHRERRRLVPGMRLADGTTYTGNSQLAGLEARIEELKSQIVALSEELTANQQKAEALRGSVKDIAVLTGATVAVSEPVDLTPPEAPVIDEPAENTASPSGESASPTLGVLQGSPVVETEVPDGSTAPGEQLYGQSGPTSQRVRRPRAISG